MKFVQSVRELRAVLDELAEIDWHHPAWWALVAGTAALERLPAPRDPERAYVTSNGGPRADTFMAQTAPRRSLAELIATGLSRARAAAHALAELDGRYPQQPLRVQLDTRGVLARRRAAEPWRVVFATPTGAFVATLDVEGRTDTALAAALARACVAAGPSPLLRPVDPSADAPLDAAIAVSLQVEELATARHLHRRGWNAGGGPWLGLGQAAELELVTTSHTVVDGFGHGELAARLSAPGRQHALAVAAARRVVGDAAPLPAPTLGAAAPLGVAMGVVSRTSFAVLAHTTAVVLERFYRRAWPAAARRAARFTPTFQVPVAPGARDDPARLRRRVVPGLLSARMADGAVEPLPTFRARLPALIAREAALGGVLSRIRAAAIRGPLPTRLVRRWLAAGASQRPWLPPVDVLAGRGCVSWLRYDTPPGRPLFAVSAPALDPDATDARGSTVLTAIETADGLALTVSGTGLAGTAAGAEEFFAELVDALEVAALNPARADTHRGQR